MATNDKNVPVSFRLSSFEGQRLVDARQSSGRLAPVFPSLVQGTKREEDYIARMIERDRKAGL